MVRVMMLRHRHVRRTLMLRGISKRRQVIVKIIHVSNQSFCKRRVLGVWGGKGPVQTTAWTASSSGDESGLRYEATTAPTEHSICGVSRYGPLLDFIATGIPFPHGTVPANQEWRFDHADIKCGFPHITEVLAKPMRPNIRPTARIAVMT